MICWRGSFKTHTFNISQQICLYNNRRSSINRCAYIDFMTACLPLRRFCFEGTFPASSRLLFYIILSTSGSFRATIPQGFSARLLSLKCSDMALKPASSSACVTQRVP